MPKPAPITKRVRLPKRERTRLQLLDAAMRILARKDPGAVSILELADEAGVAHGTVYNYFKTREEFLAAVALRLAGELSTEVNAVCEGISDPARRVSIGVRTFVRRAAAHPDWGRVFLRLTVFALRIDDSLVVNVLRDLREGSRTERFRYPSEPAAFDLVFGTTLSAMRTAATRGAKDGYDRDVACAVLRGLGVSGRTAESIANLPLPTALAEAAPGSAPPGAGMGR